MRDSWWQSELQCSPQNLFKIQQTRWICQIFDTFCRDVGKIFCISRIQMIKPFFVQNFRSSRQNAHSLTQRSHLEQSVGQCSEFSTRKTCDLCTQGSLGLLSASSKPPASLALLHSDQPRKNNTSWTSAAPSFYKCIGLDGCLGGVTSKEHLAVLINLGREISSQLFPTDTWAHSRQ